MNRFRFAGSPAALLVAVVWFTNLQVVNRAAAEEPVAKPAEADAQPTKSNDDAKPAAENKSADNKPADKPADAKDKDGQAGAALEQVLCI